MGCDCHDNDQQPDNGISIHAPTWGATNCPNRGGNLFDISIHAPTWGATIIAYEHFENLLFQSTHPRGVRLITFIFPILWPIFQSTHPRGVRHIITLFSSDCNVFQSTHPRGVRRAASKSGTTTFAFQSTHPRGVRRRRVRGPYSEVNFNPRTHVGCDRSSNTNGIRSCLFQSTHPRGVRRDIISLQPLLENFNPRTHVGCDPLAFILMPYFEHFNPRTHVGCDGIIYDLVSLEVISIHAPTWGATSHNVLIRQADKFQSTHPRGVRPISESIEASVRLFQSTHPRGVRRLRIGNHATALHFNPRTHVGCDC